MGKLQDIIKQYNKDLEGSIIKLSDAPYQGIRRVSTGSFALDMGIGGGLPCSSIIELFGDESTGKSLLALKAIAEYQKNFDKDCAYIDMEHALTGNWAKKLGVDTERLHIIQPKTAEKCLDMLIDLVSSNELGIVVIDSVASMCPIIETEEPIDKQQMGVHARLMSKALRKLAAALQPENLGDKENYNSCIVIFINQIRMKIGVMFGNPETTPGGKALKFYSHLRIRTRKGERIKNSSKVLIGQQIKFTSVKNKTYKPFQAGVISFYYDGHIDNQESIVNYAIAFELIKQKKAWFFFDGKQFHGEAKLIAYLKKQPKVLIKLKKDIINIVKKD